MTILTVPIGLWDLAWVQDPDAMAEAVADLWDGCYVPRQGGRTGGTYDGDGNRLTPDTHYQWSLGARVRDVDEQTDGLEELSVLVETVIAADAVPADETGNQAAMQRARRLAGRDERSDERQAQRVAARTARRTEARKAYRTASRTEARKAYNAQKGDGDPNWGDLDTATQDSYDLWPEWSDLDDYAKAGWIRAAANTVGHPDITITG
ncbi:MAG: hypothetical protein GY925_26625 [Actinomycetia bacterium]|nr:hypothetical protein [Actinomycetes bacterium]